jgi:hypothetical protein
VGERARRRRGGAVRRRGDRAEAVALACLGSAHHLARLPDRNGGLPPICAAARRRAAHGRPDLDRVDGVSGRLPDSRGVHDLGVRALEDYCGSDGGKTCLVPPVAILLGWAMLGEVPSCSPSSAARALPRRGRYCTAVIAALRGKTRLRPYELGRYNPRPRAVSSVGRAPARQAGGHWFEPSTAHSPDEVRLRLRRSHDDFVGYRS